MHLGKNFAYRCLTSKKLPYKILRHPFLSVFSILVKNKKDPGLRSWEVSETNFEKTPNFAWTMPLPERDHTPILSPFRPLVRPQRPSEVLPWLGIVKIDICKETPVSTSRGFSVDKNQLTVRFSSKSERFSKFRKFSKNFKNSKNL